MMKSQPIKLPCGKWRVRIYPFKGSKSCRQKTANTKRECLEWANNEYQRLRHGKEETDNRKLSELVSLWWLNYGVNLKSGKDRLSMMNNFIQEVGDMKWKNFTAQTFLTWRNNKTSMGANSKNHILSYFKTLFTKLEQDDLISFTKHPLASVKNLKFQDTPVRSLTDKEIKAVYEASKADYPLHLFIKVSLATGFRYSETINLKLENLHSNLITLSNTKNSRSRSVPINSELFIELKKFLENRKFPELSKKFGFLIKDLKIKLPRGQLTHVLRHTFASHFLMNGGDLVTLKKVLGHTDIKTTMRYSHLAQDFLKKVVSFNPLANFS